MCHEWSCAACHALLFAVDRVEEELLFSSCCQYISKLTAELEQVGCSDFRGSVFSAL